MLSDDATCPQQAGGENPDPIPLPGIDSAGPDDAGPGAGGGVVVRTAVRPPLLIHCPRGPGPVRTGYAIYAARFAVDEDGQPDVLAAVCLDRTDSVMRAQVMSRAYALQPERYGIREMEAVIVTDAAGRTVLRRELEPAA